MGWVKSGSFDCLVMTNCTIACGETKQHILTSPCRIQRIQREEGWSSLLFSHLALFRHILPDVCLFLELAPAVHEGGEHALSQLKQHAVNWFHVPKGYGSTLHQFLVGFWPELCLGMSLSSWPGFFFCLVAFLNACLSVVVGCFRAVQADLAFVDILYNIVRPGLVEWLQSRAYPKMWWQLKSEFRALLLSVREMRR